jgi:hypothetical protein
LCASRIDPSASRVSDIFMTTPKTTLSTGTWTLNKTYRNLTYPPQNHPPETQTPRTAWMHKKEPRFMFTGLKRLRIERQR